MSKPTTPPRRKPPLGPEPEWLWREKRMWHLITRLAGYADEPDHTINLDWLKELRARLDDVITRAEAPPTPYNSTLN